jgi:hypothetical protein
MLYTYHHKPETVLIEAGWLEWVNQYIADSLATAGPAVRKNERQIRAHKLGTIAFAQRFGLHDQWERKQTKPSAWPPWVDFEVGDHSIRIVSVAANAEEFGYRATGKVWNREYSSGRHSLYVLTVWWAPYLDIVGWLKREDLENFPAPWGYSLQEPAVRPMSEIPIRKLADS